MRKIITLAAIVFASCNNLSVGPQVQSDAPVEPKDESQYLDTVIVFQNGEGSLQITDKRNGNTIEVKQSNRGGQSSTIVIEGGGGNEITVIQQ